MQRYLLYILLSYSFLYAEQISLGTIEINDSLESSLSTDQTDTKKLAQNTQGETLGDYLNNQEFINSATFGPAVGRPVIKGLDGYRVGITNGSISQNDLSAMSHDHSVAMMPKTVEKIEFIKGPSSLLYGNNSAGVIKTLGVEHNKNLVNKGFSGTFENSYGSNGAGDLYGGKLQYGFKNQSIFISHYTNEASDYKDGDGNTINDSDTLSIQTHLVYGLQLNSQHLLKAYFDTLTKEYGIPNLTDERTSIDMEQTRYGMVLHSTDVLGSSSMQSEIQYSDYLHTEYEGTSADGLFGQKLFSVSNIANFQKENSAIKTSIQFNSSKYEVCHEHGKCTEFTQAIRTGIEDGISLQQNIDRFDLGFSHGHPMPNINEKTLKLGAIVKQTVNDTTDLDISLRSEFRKMDIDSSNIQEEWLVTKSIDEDYYDNKNDKAFSGSVGLYSYFDDLSIESSISYIERLPSGNELYWNGFHHATNSYIFGDRKLENEKSTNIDISFFYEKDNYTSKLSTYYYDFYNYLFQTQLDGVTDPFHNTIAWEMKGKEATLYGISFENTLKQNISSINFLHSFTYESIRGKLSNGENIPRMMPDKIKISSKIKYKKFETKIEYNYVDKSRHLAPVESPTPSYNTLNIYSQYKNRSVLGEYKLYLKGYNLTNEQIYNHISFLKSSAPLSGRKFVVGMRLDF